MIAESRYQLARETLRVVAVTPEADARWSAFVLNHPDGLVYHHPAWLQVLQTEYQREAIGLICEDESGAVCGVLPLCYTQGLPFRRHGHITGRRLSSLPRTPVAGPLTTDSRATAALVQAALELTRHMPATRLELKLWGAQVDELATGVSTAPWRQTYLLELPDKPEQVRFGNARNHSRIKWSINKAAKMGVRVRAAETESDLQIWYMLYLETVQRHAMPARSYRFFRACWDLLRPLGMLRLLLAEQHDGPARRLLAGSLFLTAGRTWLYAFNGSRRSDLALRPNDAIQWEAIHAACREGYHAYDFGEVADANESLAEFKGKWGAEPRQLHRCYSPPAAAEATDPLDRQSGPRQLVNRLWRRLPLPVVARVGDWFYSYL